MAFLPLMSWHSKDESHRVSSTWRAPHREVVSPCQVCLNPASLWLRRDNNSKSGIIYFLLKCWWQGVCFVFVTPVYRKSAWSEVSQHRPNTLLPSSFLSFLIIWVCSCLSLLHCHLWYDLRPHSHHHFPLWSCQIGAPKTPCYKSVSCASPKGPGGFFLLLFFITSKVVWLAASSAAITHPQYRVTSRWCSLTQLCAYAMACWLLRESFNWDFDWNGTHLPYKS